MPKVARGEIRPMSDTTLDCCDVIKGSGLFSRNKYILRNMNMKREDKNKTVYLLRRGEMFISSFPYAIYLKALSDCYDFRQVMRAANLYIDHMRQQRAHPTKLLCAYIETRLTIIKWWMR